MEKSFGEILKAAYDESGDQPPSGSLNSSSSESPYPKSSDSSPYFFSGSSSLSNIESSSIQFRHESPNLSNETNFSMVVHTGSSSSTGGSDMEENRTNSSISNISHINVGSNSLINEDEYVFIDNTSSRNSISSDQPFIANMNEEVYDLRISAPTYEREINHQDENPMEMGHEESNVQVDSINNIFDKKDEPQNMMESHNNSSDNGQTYQQQTCPPPSNNYCDISSNFMVGTTIAGSTYETRQYSSLPNYNIAEDPRSVNSQVSYQTSWGNGMQTMSPEGVPFQQYQQPLDLSLPYNAPIDYSQHNYVENNVSNVYAPPISMNNTPSVNCEYQSSLGMSNVNSFNTTSTYGTVPENHFNNNVSNFNQQNGTNQPLFGNNATQQYPGLSSFNQSSPYPYSGGQASQYGNVNTYSVNRSHYQNMEESVDQQAIDRAFQMHINSIESQRSMIHNNIPQNLTLLSSYNGENVQQQQQHSNVNKPSSSTSGNGESSNSRHPDLFIIEAILNNVREDGDRNFAFYTQLISLFYSQYISRIQAPPQQHLNVNNLNDNNSNVGNSDGATDEEETQS
uniref:PUM-HD domain-containing protein n=1 Tax=Parastrongyloides trichosuri TaxID=131310 RepID=A0A0N4Z9Z5_PARTI